MYTDIGISNTGTSVTTLTSVLYYIALHCTAVNLHYQVHVLGNDDDNDDEMMMMMVATTLITAHLG